MGNEHFKSQQLRSKSPLPFSWLLAVTTLGTSVFCDSTINLDTDFSTIKRVLYFNKTAAIMLMASPSLLPLAWLSNAIQFSDHIHYIKNTSKHVQVSSNLRGKVHPLPKAGVFHQIGL